MLLKVFFTQYIYINIFLSKKICCYLKKALHLNIYKGFISVVNGNIS